MRFWKFKTDKSVTPDYLEGDRAVLALTVSEVDAKNELIVRIPPGSTSLNHKFASVLFGMLRDNPMLIQNACEQLDTHGENGRLVKEEFLDCITLYEEEIGDDEECPGCPNCENDLDDPFILPSQVSQQLIATVEREDHE